MCAMLLADVQRLFQSIKDRYKYNFNLKVKQMEVLLSILERKDTLAVLPTGYGKTECFVLPALMLEEDKCGSVVDKYVEYDLVIVSLDALLLKRQAFRHILINSGIQSHWKFCLVLLISEAIIKLLNQPVTEDTKQWKSDNVIYSALEFDLYWNFLTSAIELFCFLFVVLMCVLVWKNIRGEHKDQWPSMQECACGLMLSSLGKVLVLPAILWGLNYSVLYTWLCTLFTIAANIQAVRVLCPMWNVLAVTVCILLGHFSTYGARDLLLRAKSAIT